MFIYVWTWEGPPPGRLQPLEVWVCCFLSSIVDSQECNMCWGLLDGYFTYSNIMIFFVVGSLALGSYSVFMVPTVAQTTYCSGCPVSVHSAHTTMVMWSVTYKNTFIELVD